METPSKGYFRLFPGNKVRLRYGFVIECTGCTKDNEGRITAVHCNYFADSKSGTAGSNNYKVKGNIHWVSAKHAYAAEVRMYDRLFKVPHPGARREGDPEGVERDILDDMNPESVRVITAYVEPLLREAKQEEHFQFERHGYFVADRIDSRPGAPKFNRAVSLKDSWGPAPGK
jgi:glutaminyl-tRNA synthetase